MSEAGEIQTTAKCPECAGRGRHETGEMEKGAGGWGFQSVDCEICGGTGEAPKMTGRSEPNVWVGGKRSLIPTVSVEVSAVSAGPSVMWRHIDGPMIEWACFVDWLTWRERAALALRLTTIDALACKRWPQLARARAALAKATP